MTVMVWAKVAIVLHEGDWALLLVDQRPGMFGFGLGFFITACAGRFCFAPYARVSFGIAPKETKRSSPHLGSSLRSDFPRSVAAPGAGEKGHPWPSRLSRLPAAQPLPRRLHSACAQGAGRSRSKARSKTDQMPLTPTLARKRETGPFFVGATLVANPGKGVLELCLQGSPASWLLRKAKPNVTPRPLGRPGRREGPGERGF